MAVENANVAPVVLLDHEDRTVAMMLVALQRASYQVEAELIGDDAIPPLHESADELAALDLTFLAIEREDETVATLGYRVVDAVLDIDRLAVHPRHFREGLGKRLLSAVLERVPHERAVVSTGRRNHPARELYERVGFTHRADVAITPTLVVSKYERVAPEEQLHGGADNIGGVVRAGATVRRPVSARAPLTHAFLAYLAEQGFDAAPRVLGFDDQGREILDYLEGEVATDPLPCWVADDELLVSVARLQRRLHVAAEGFTVSPEHRPLIRQLDGSLAEYDGALMCHQDICESNVIVRDGEAVAVIDFDLASPCDPVFDIAMAAHYWVPLRAPADLEEARAHLGSENLVQRFRQYLEVFDLSPADRHRVVASHQAWCERIIPGMRRAADSGHPGFVRIWNDGFEARIRRTLAWVEEHTTGLLAPS